MNSPQPDREPSLADFTSGETKYDALGVAADAGQQVIKKAFRRQALLYHPDRHPEEDRQEAAKIFRLINDAYQVLSDPDKRRRYDHALAKDLAYDDAGGGGGEGDISLQQVLTDILKYEHIFDDSKLGRLDDTLQKMIKQNMIEEVGERIVEVITMSAAPVNYDHQGVFVHGALVLTNLRAIFPFHTSHSEESGNTRTTTRYYYAPSMLLVSLKSVRLELLSRKSQEYQVMFNSSETNLTFLPKYSNLSKVILLCDLWSVPLETIEVDARGSDIRKTLFEPPGVIAILYTVAYAIAAVIGLCNDGIVESASTVTGFFLNSHIFSLTLIIWALWSGISLSRCFLVYDRQRLDCLFDDLNGEQQ